MKSVYLKIVLSLSCLLPAGFLQAQQTTGKERFAGLHFDFHAGITDSGIGKTFTPEMIDSLLSMVKPDFIQVDCKGHPGVSSYPTKVGHPAPAIEKDILKIWRAVTEKYGVPLYVHYSGIWDNEALKAHPEWARYNADGNPNVNATSLFSDYKTELLIPQLKELATSYHLDGVWVDGDCWMLSPDYSPASKGAFTKETGISAVPGKKDDPYYFEWMEFNRKKFRDYITLYADEVHKVAPNFKVTSNWSFSSMMPEPVDVPVDYLSGDVAGSNSIYSSAFESRCLALQGKPWDLMSWSFAWKNNAKATKSVLQLQQEAAEVLAMGGGFQTYWQQNRDGTPEPYQFRKMQEIVAFCKERKAFTFNGAMVPQIGILYSTYAWKRIPNDGLYNADGQEAMKGVLNMLLDSQLPAEILMDHQLKGRLNKYPLLIIPEWTHIDPAIREQVLDYVKQGGNLLIIGAEAIQDYANELGVRISSPMLEKTAVFAGFADRIVLMQTNFQPTKPNEGTTVFGTQFKADDLRFTTENYLASLTPYGKGKIAGIYLNIGSFYNNNQNPVSI
ncbi:MAG TPA: alpha-amylase family protein, partial [Agriterribacter sp.]|nr:alpha-amylase family protein [Agriterribacter sp.]